MQTIGYIISYGLHLKQEEIMNKTWTEHYPNYEKRMTEITKAVHWWINNAHIIDFRLI